MQANRFWRGENTGGIVFRDARLPIATVDFYAIFIAARHQNPVIRHHEIARVGAGVKIAFSPEQTIVGKATGF